MSYEHHVFLSYCWMPGYAERTLLRRWVCKQFVLLLEHNLMSELPKSIGRPVFVDTDCETGPDFRVAIADAHQRSAILVPVLDAQYFSSPWCQAEWDAFMAREAKAGQAGLIYPVIFGDGKSFREEAHIRNPVDLSRHAVLYSLDDPSRGCEDFQKEMLRISKEIARRVTQAPACQPDWPKLQYPGWDIARTVGSVSSFPTW